MRYWMMSNHELTLEVNRIIIRSIRALLRKKSRQKGVANGVIGAVTFMQRFGSGLNSHPHYHILVVDGVFTENEDPELVPEFIEAAPFDDCEIADLARRICTAVRKHLANIGQDVFYSGTVAAAMEGCIHGIPSIAFSLDIRFTRNLAPAIKK